MIQMATKRFFILHLKVLLISSLLISCNNEVSKSIEKTVYFSDLKNNIISCVINQDGEIIKIDTIKTNSFIKSKNYNSASIKNGLYISNFNPIYDIEKNKVVFNNDTSIYLRITNDSIIYYDFKEKSINYLEIKNGQKINKFNKNKFEMPIVNRTPHFEFISLDFKKVIIPKPNDSIDKNLNKSYTLFVYNIEENKTIDTIKNVTGTIMSDFSSTISSPSIIWTKNDEFFIANNFLTEQKCNIKITKYNITKKTNEEIAKVNDVKLSTNNGKFKTDFYGNLFYFINQDVYFVNLNTNSISKNFIFYLNEKFSIKKSNEKYIIQFNNKKISKDYQDFYFNEASYKVSENFIIVKDKNKYKVWFDANNDFKDIDVNIENDLLGIK